MDNAKSTHATALDDTETKVLTVSDRARVSTEVLERAALCLSIEATFAVGAMLLEARQVETMGGTKRGIASRCFSDVLIFAS